MTVTLPVGPQVAEKLGWPQVTYAEEMHFEGDKLIIRRRLEREWRQYQLLFRW